MIELPVLKDAINMTPQDRKKLEKILKALNEGQALIQELLLEEGNERSGREPSSGFDTSAFISSLKSVERAIAESRLNELKQHELGAIFVKCGGPTIDKKKPKVWLIEQILWRIFDFERGHEAIRSAGAGEQKPD